MKREKDIYNEEFWRNQIYKELKAELQDKKQHTPACGDWIVYYNANDVENAIDKIKYNKDIKPIKRNKNIDENERINNLIKDLINKFNTYLQELSKKATVLDYEGNKVTPIIFNEDVADPTNLQFYNLETLFIPAFKIQYIKEIKD